MSRQGAPSVRRLVAIGVAVIVVAAAVFGVVRACGSDGQAPADRAARLVPSDALIFVRLSTDRDREGVRRALDLATRFPGLPVLRDSLLRGLSRGSGQGFSFERDVEPWLGDEAALGLLNTTGATAGSVILLAVKDRGAAQAFLTRAAGAGETFSYRGTDIERFDQTVTAFVGGFLAIGQENSVRAAIDREGGRGRSLEEAAGFRRGREKLPEDRVADAYASRAGVRRLLASQGGPLGALGVLLDQPALTSATLALTAEERGARVAVRSMLDRRVSRRTPSRPFTPALLKDVPADALAYLGLAGLDRSAARLLTVSSAGGGTGAQVSALLARVARGLERGGEVDLERDVVAPFRGEVALWLGAAIPAPTLTVIARTRDEQATRRAFARLQVPLARLFVPPSARGRRAPAFRERDVAGVTAYTLRLGPGVELNYAVFDGKLVVSTALGGIRAVRESSTSSVAGAQALRAARAKGPKRVTSLVFLDFSQLLRLGEQTGLRESRAYLAVREDLSKVRAVGAAASGGEEESTGELFLSIP